MNAGHREAHRLPDAPDNDDRYDGDEHSDPRRHISVCGVSEQGCYRHKPNNKHNRDKRINVCPPFVGLQTFNGNARSQPCRHPS